MAILIDILTIVLVLVSIFMILLVLMQRGSAAGGLGAAMGGGMAESALGAESSSVLSRWTRNVAILFFVLVFGLYLGRLKVHEDEMKAEDATLPQFEGAADTSAASALQELISSAEEEAEAEGEAAAGEAQDVAEPAAQDAAEEQPAAQEGDAATEQE